MRYSIPGAVKNKKPLSLEVPGVSYAATFTFGAQMQYMNKQSGISFGFGKAVDLLGSRDGDMYAWGHRNGEGPETQRTFAEIGINTWGLSSEKTELNANGNILESTTKNTATFLSCININELKDNKTGASTMWLSIGYSVKMGFIMGGELSIDAPVFRLTK